MDLGCPGLLSDVLPEDEEKKDEGLITEMGERIRGGFMLTENRVKPMHPKALCAFIQGIEGEHGEKSTGTTPERPAKGGGPITTSVV